MPLVLRWSDATTLPVVADSLRPEVLAGLSAVEVARRPIPSGNATAEVGDLFAVTGDSGDGRVIFEGDLSRVRRIGAGLSSGHLSIRGNAGMHVGAEMSGGSIDVVGNVAEGAATGMRGGFLRIRGDGGDDLGAALPGARIGMREGVILVEGTIGDGAGLAMRRGLIAVSGTAGADLGRGMIAGSIFAFGPIGPRAGAGMKRGTLALFGLENPRVPGLPSTFHASGVDRPPVATVYLRQLRDWGFPVPARAFGGRFRRYNGDRNERGRGEVWAWIAGGDENR